MKPKDFLIPAVISVILTALSGLVRGFPLRFLEPILTIQMVGAPAPLFPFRIIFTSLLIDLVFWFLLTFAAWWGFKFWSRMTLILVLGLFVVLGVAIFWQYNLHQTLSQTDMACGGDWSYTVKCPPGSSCRSLGEGPLAGGVCKPWLSAVFGIFKVQKEQIPAPSPTPTPTPAPAPEPTSLPTTDETDKMYQVVQTSTSPDGSYYVTYSVLADHQKFTIKNKQGVTVFDNLLDRITEDIWEGMQNLGLKGRGQVGYEISSWIDNSKFVLRILPASGEKYETIVNAKSGVIDKSSFREIE